MAHGMAARLERLERQSGAGLRPVVVIHQYEGCMIHGTPGPEYLQAGDGSPEPVTDALRDRWEREGARIFVCSYVGNCHTEGCTPEEGGR